MVAALRELNGNVEGTARQAQVGRKLARRAWQTGWPSAGFRAVKDLLREEEVAARAEQRRLEEAEKRKTAEERDKARSDAIAAMAAEGRILALARNDVQGALACANVMLPALRALAEAIATSLQADPTQISPAKGVELIQRYSVAVKSLTQAGEQLVRAERLHKGEPTDILGVQHSASEMSVEEAVREIQTTVGLYELAKRRGLIAPDEADPNQPASNPGVPPGMPVN